MALQKTSDQAAEQGVRGGAISPEKRISKRVRLSVVDEPSLLDHSLIPQPEGWQDVSDRNPVVPMTMMLELMRTAAAERFGGVATGLRQVRARKWLAVHPAVDLEIETERLSNGRVRVALGEYATGEVVLQPEYSTPAERATVELQDARIPRVSAERLYRERWMFHGPEYQSVRSIDAITEKGIDGTLWALPADGALLDGAGQLFGYWVMESVDVDRLAMPVGIEAIDWYADEPSQTTPVECRVRPRRLSARDTVADLDLLVDGQPFCFIRGWHDWRFEVDERLWRVMQRTEAHLLATPTSDGWVRLHDAGRSATSMDYLVRRYCNARERAEFAYVPQKQRLRWLRGRVAMKDAVRHLLGVKYQLQVFPVEIDIAYTEARAPLVRLASGPTPLYVSLTHKGDTSVALAHDGGPVGIDLESIESRDSAFLRLAFTSDELQLVPAVESDEALVWYMRLWCAKEAVSKARGTGLQGRPKDWVTTHIAGERLLCDGQWVETRCIEEGVVAWTIDEIVTPAPERDTC